MTGRVLTLLLAAVSVAPGVPIEETFYQILGPDSTTVLCDSRTTGSCDPFLPEFDVFRFSINTDFSVSQHQVIPFPIELRADTDFFGADVNSDTLADHFVRFSYFFEDEIDIGLYTYIGGTGDFLALYQTFVGDNRGPFSASIDPGPFPLGFDFVEVAATFGQPFRVRAHYRISYDVLLSARFSFVGGWGAHWFSQFQGEGRYPGDTQRFGVLMASVPEPGGLSLLGLSAILGAVVMRKYLDVRRRIADRSVTP